MSNYRITDFQPKIAKEDLITLVSKCQERTFSEDIDYIQQKGGDQAFSGLLGVDFNRGLDSGEISTRGGLYGTNQHEEVPMKSFIELMKTALEDFTLRILLVAAFVSVVANMIVEKDHRNIAWIEGFTIFMAVMICSSVTALNDYQKEKQFRKLNEVAVSKKTVHVWRDGKLMSVHESELVTGDIVKITEGMYLNADMMLLQAFDITIDEAALTGEANAIRKMTYQECVSTRDALVAEGKISLTPSSHTYSPILLSGTTVLTGEGKAVVLVVGEQSCIGRIRSLVQQEPGTTPLQEKLEVIAEDIGKFGLVSAIITFFILLLRFFIDRIQTDTLGDFDEYVQIVNYIIIAITVVVVAIPEGLPLAVTLSLAYSMHQMLKDNNLVRRMEATETMGGADNICTDKTGTLTQNKMTLTAFWNMRLNPIDGYKPGRLEDIFNPKCHDLIKQALACNSSATLNPAHGSKTEICLLEFLERYDEDYERIRSRYVDNKAIRLPFSSSRKRMSTIIEIGDEGRKRRLHTKGAAEIILTACDSMYDFDEMKIVALTSEMRQKIEEQIEIMADQALRTLCIAYKDISEQEDVKTKGAHDVFRVEEDGLILLGILGVKDILRKEVKVAIAECKAAGIKVRMVTGDNKTTARAIARDCGIIDPYDSTNSLIMTGPEFMERVGGIVCKNCRTRDCDCPKDKAQAERTGKEMRVDVIANSTEFDKIYGRLDVLARSRPEDKYALVAGLIERGAVVAVTGDGTNDAPALKKADVGFAMNSGTEVAKEAADIILIDDNFASIVESVKWGRNIYENIRKFLQFQLTVNVVAVGITLVGAGILKEAVFTAVQLLWMNLIMDTLASLALATETPNEKILGKKPYDRNEYILSNSMKKHIIGQAVYQFVIIIFLIFTGDMWIPESLDKVEIEGSPGQLKYYSDSMHVRSGRSYFVTTGGYDYEKLESVLGPSRHFTIVFNTFVFLQVFNFLNCRKLNDERKIFEGITKNKFFLGIVFLITILQVLIINFGGFPMSVSFHGLDIVQWLICLVLASGCIVWSSVLKRIQYDFSWRSIKKSNFELKLPIPTGRKGSFERLPSIDLDKHETYLSGDASPAKKDQELGLLHIKTH